MSNSPTKSSSPTKVASPDTGNPPPSAPKKKPLRGPCKHLCSLVPMDLPDPPTTQRVLHPHKDVFVLKVAKVGPLGHKRCKMELELVTPKSNIKSPPYRMDTRGTQADGCECPPCTQCCRRKKKRN